MEKTRSSFTPNAFSTQTPVLDDENPFLELRYYSVTAESSFSHDNDPLNISSFSFSSNALSSTRTRQNRHSSLYSPYLLHYGTQSTSNHSPALSPGAIFLRTPDYDHQDGTSSYRLNQISSWCLRKSASPVVRKSLGDATPSYSRRSSSNATYSSSHIALQSPQVTVTPPQNLLPKLPQRTTPFLERLNLMTNTYIDDDDDDVAMLSDSIKEELSSTLASPFKSATSDRTIGTNSSASAPGIPTTPLRYNMETPAAQPPIPELSPLSELTPSPPVLPRPQLPSPPSPQESDLQKFIREYGWLHTMTRRSHAKDIPSLAPESFVSTPKPKQNTKRKRSDVIHRMENAGARNPPKPKQSRSNPNPKSKFYLPRTRSAESASVKLKQDQTEGDDSSGSQNVIVTRTFPSEVIIHPNYARFYQRYHISSYFITSDGSVTELLGTKSSSNWFAVPQAPFSPFDLYAPRFTKGVGKDKFGLCPICVEKTERGGEGRCVWLNMKFSAYKCYHMQFTHGISCLTGLPFSPPLGFRTINRLAKEIRAHQKTKIMQGKCHRCCKWVAVEGVKEVEVKIKELVWWKHASSCHGESTIKGEDDIYIQDDVFKRVKDMVGKN